MKLDKLEGYIQSLSNTDLHALYVGTKRGCQRSLQVNVFNYTSLVNINDLTFLSQIFERSRSIDKHIIAENLRECIHRETKIEIGQRFDMSFELKDKYSNSYTIIKNTSYNTHFVFKNFKITSTLKKEKMYPNEKQYSHVIDCNPSICGFRKQITDIAVYNRNKHDALFDINNFIGEFREQIKSAVIVECLIKIDDLTPNDKISKPLPESDEPKRSTIDYRVTIIDHFKKLDITKIDGVASQISTVPEFLKYFNLELNHADLKEFLNNLPYEARQLKTLGEVFKFKVNECANRVKADKYSVHFNADSIQLDFDIDEDLRWKKTYVKVGQEEAYFIIKYNQSDKSYYLECGIRNRSNWNGSYEKKIETVQRYNKDYLKSLKLTDELIQSAVNYLYRSGFIIEKNDGFY